MATRINIALPDHILASYDIQAKEQDLPLETLLARRLESCVLHTAGRGLYFDDQERNELEQLCDGHLLKSAQDALKWLRRLFTLRLADKGGRTVVKLRLEPRLLQRLKTRAIGMEFGDFVAHTTRLELERYCNLR